MKSVDLPALKAARKRADALKLVVHPDPFVRLIVAQAIARERQLHQARAAIVDAFGIFSQDIKNERRARAQATSNNNDDAERETKVRWRSQSCCFRFRVSLCTRCSCCVVVVAITRGWRAVRGKGTPVLPRAWKAQVSHQSVVCTAWPRWVVCYRGTPRPTRSETRPPQGLPAATPREVSV